MGRVLRMPERRTKTIRTDYLARVEGEGAMLVTIDDGEVSDVKLKIYEPPRFFEAFLRGRAFTEAPDITARICGILLMYDEDTNSSTKEALKQLSESLSDIVE